MTDLLEFGIKRDNEERRDGGCAVVFDPVSQKYAVGMNNLKNDDTGDAFRLFGGGLDKDENIKDGIMREVLEESGLYDFVYVEKIDKVLCHYANSSKKVNRCAEATCFLIILNSINLKPTKHEEHEKFHLEWVNAKEILASWNLYNQKKDFDHWIYFMKKAVNRAIELGYDKTSDII